MMLPFCVARDFPSDMESFSRQMSLAPLGVEQIGTGQPQDLAPVVAGNPFGRRVEKGDQPPAIDREDADVDAV